MTRSIIGAQGLGVCLRRRRSARPITRAVNAKNSRTARSGSFAVESSPLGRDFDRQSSRQRQGGDRPNGHEAPLNTRHRLVGEE